MERLFYLHAVTAPAYSLSTGVLQKHCSEAFMKQVLPRLHSPTRPSVLGHTSEFFFLLLALEGLSAALFCAMLPRGQLSVLGSRSSMNRRCPSTCNTDILDLYTE